MRIQFPLATLLVAVTVATAHAATTRPVEREDLVGVWAADELSCQSDGAYEYRRDGSYSVDMGHGVWAMKGRNVRLFLLFVDEPDEIHEVSFDVEIVDRTHQLRRQGNGTFDAAVLCGGTLAGTVVRKPGDTKFVEARAGDEWWMEETPEVAALLDKNCPSGKACIALVDATLSEAGKYGPDGRYKYQLFPAKLLRRADTLQELLQR